MSDFFDSSFALERQPNIWEPKCPTCLLWESCGGSDTAPCQCVWSDKKKSHNCASCRYICTERYAPPYNGRLDTFPIHAHLGKDLEEINLDQRNLSTPLPLLIPLQTDKLSSDIQLNHDWNWVGIDLKFLVSKHKNPPVYPKSYLDSPLQVRKFANVTKDCNLLAIMNGKDELLESFWASDRVEIYNALEKSNFVASTGPTFSIYGYKGKVKVPDSHSVSMLRRHHQCVEELNGRNIIPIPNIYWRNNRDIAKLVQFLSKNESISMISRDFTCTRRGQELKYYFAQLIELIQKVGRKLHIVFQGISVAEAANVINRLAQIGCTCSLATPDPIIKGLRGNELLFNGKKRPKIIKNISNSLPELAFKNLYVMKEYLNAVAAPLSVYSGKI